MNKPKKPVRGTMEELEKAKLLLWSLMRDCDHRMAKAEASRRELEGDLERFRGVFQENLGCMNVFQVEETRSKLRKIEHDAERYDRELSDLRRQYDRMVKEYSKLCE